MNKGRPKKPPSKNIFSEEKLEKFRVRVAQGQSITMLCWEFKISSAEVKRLCKENNLILNTGDYLIFANRYHRGNV